MAPAIRLVVLIVLVLLALSSPPARADKQDCIVVNKVPAVLSVPGGHYCLARDFTPTVVNGQYTILVDANDILFDCRGFLIRNNNSGAIVPGITTIDRYRVTIRNCVIDGFSTGIQMGSPVGAPTTDNVVENNTILNSARIGILVTGSRHRVEGNRVYWTSHDFNGVTYGIHMNNGRDNQVRGNVIGPIVPSPICCGGTTFGISIATMQDTQLVGNTVSGLYSDSAPVAAIEVYESTQTVVSGNTVLSAPPRPAPLDGPHANGILLTGTQQEQASNVCSDNTVGHFVTNISGCVDAGNTTF